MLLPLLIVAMIVVLLSVAVWRFERFATTRRDEQHAIEIQRLRQEREHAERELELKAREIAITERAAPPVDVPPVAEFPPEIVAIAMDESEEWAREDGLKLIAEAYVEADGDWSRASHVLAMRYATLPEPRAPRLLS